MVLLKLDFQKAYDTINWGFIDHVLELMGFGKTWRQWTKICMSIASISILVNGSLMAPFKMERGLRQRDTLSPFLFVLAAEMFNVLMNRVVSLGLFEVIKVGSEEVCVLHLQFADDTLGFCPAKPRATQFEKDHGLLPAAIGP